MRLVTIDSRETGGRPGVVVTGTEVAGGEILDIVASPGSLADTQWLPQSVVSVLAAGADGLAQTARMVAMVHQATAGERAALREAGRLLPCASTALLAPVRRPGLMLMLEAADQPVAGAWIKSPNAASAPARRVTLPARLERLDVRPRVGLVLGRPLFGAGRDQAARAIAGFTLVADLGPAPVPGAAAEGGSRPGRQFPGACPLGPAIYTPDELPARPPVRLECRVNGHVVADSAVDLGADSLARLLASVSTSYALRPGDIIALPATATGVTIGAGDRCSLALADLPELSFTVG